MLLPTRWKLKKAVKQVNEILAELNVKQHPDKTFIGRAERGFDFLGYSFKPGLLGVAEKTIANMKERITRLYEQGADTVGIGQYVLRWLRWVVAGVDDSIFKLSMYYHFRRKILDFFKLLIVSSRTTLGFAIYGRVIFLLTLNQCVLLFVVMPMILGRI